MSAALDWFIKAYHINSVALSDQDNSNVAQYLKTNLKIENKFGDMIWMRADEPPDVTWNSTNLCWVITSTDSISKTASLFERFNLKLDAKITKTMRMLAALEKDKGVATNIVVFKPDDYICRGLNKATLTWASGDMCRSKEFKVYLNSLSKHCGHIDRYIFTHDMDLDSRIEVESLGFKIKDVDPSCVKFLVRDRFKVFADFIESHDYGYVLTTDSKDVLFQRDPFSWNYILWNGVVFSYEGMTHEKSEWNTKDQAAVQSNLKGFNIDFSKWPVINGGVIYGKKEALIVLFNLIWFGTVMSNGTCSDQGMLNYIYNYLLKKKYSDPYGDCYTAGPEGNFILTGEAVKEGFVNKDYEKYYMFHQWDRTEYASEIIKKWADDLM